MSFHVSFAAHVSDVPKILEGHPYVPEPVKAFIGAGCRAWADKPEQIVRIIATGHLFNGDHPHSNTTIEVIPVDIKKPLG